MYGPGLFCMGCCSLAHHETAHPLGLRGWIAAQRFLAKMGDSTIVTRNRWGAACLAEASYEGKCAQRRDAAKTILLVGQKKKSTARGKFINSSGEELMNLSVEPSSKESGFFIDDQHTQIHSTKNTLYICPVAHQRRFSTSDRKQTQLPSSPRLSPRHDAAAPAGVEVKELREEV